MPVEIQPFRDALACWPSGVTIVTTVNNGQRKGMTVSSFSSVSLEPPQILVCVAKNLLTHEMMFASRVFAVNVLTDGQAYLGQVFAGLIPEVEDRFTTGSWETAATGSPTLADAMMWLDCAVIHAYEGGDHTIFVGEVVAVGVPQMTAEQKLPLLYHNRRWGSFAELEQQTPLG